MSFTCSTCGKETSVFNHCSSEPLPATKYKERKIDTKKPRTNEIRSLGIRCSKCNWTFATATINKKFFCPKCLREERKRIGYIKRGYGKLKK